MDAIDPGRLKWAAPENLRWLADNPGAGYLPCGMLHGVFLKAVADKLESLVAEKFSRCSP